MSPRRLRLLRDVWGGLGALVLSAAALCLWFGDAAAAQVQITPASVRNWTAALSETGPWLGMTLVFGGATYLEIQRRVQRSELRDEIAKRTAENLELRKQLAAQQEALVACLKEGADRMNAHTKEATTAFGKAANSIERMADRIAGLEVTLREKYRDG